MARVARHADDLYGSTPDEAETVLLLVDVINAMDFPGSAHLVKQAVPAARRLAALKERCRKRNIPAIYVNDNFGRWRSHFQGLVEHCLHRDVPGREVVTQLLPREEDYFVLKPKNSGFYETSLEILLVHMRCKRIVLTGFAGDNCVLFTANDAYLRGYELWIPRDCTASVGAKDNAAALAYMQRVLGADTAASTARRA